MGHSVNKQVLMAGERLLAADAGAESLRRIQLFIHSSFTLRSTLCGLHFATILRI